MGVAFSSFVGACLEYLGLKGSQRGSFATNPHGRFNNLGHPFELAKTGNGKGLTENIDLEAGIKILVKFGANELDSAPGLQLFLFFPS